MQVAGSALDRISAMPARQDRTKNVRPDWLRRKHAGPEPPRGDIREHFEQLVLQALDAGRPARLSDGNGGVLFGTADEAKDEGRLLYSTALRLGVSVATRITDPATGPPKSSSARSPTSPSSRGGDLSHQRQPEHGHRKRPVPAEPAR
jgi:hypothetical protein